MAGLTAAAASSGPSFGASLGQGFAAGAGAGATSGLFGQLFGGWNARRQWKYQRKAMALQQQYALEQMQKQFEYQQQQFDYENAYNDPSAVMARFRKAGINPSAVMGSSGASMSATMPMPSSPSGHGVSGGPAIGAGAEPNMSSALIGSQIRLNDANATEAESRSNLNDEKSVTEASVRNVLGATVDEKVQNAFFLKQKALYQEMVNARTPEMLDQSVQKLIAETDNLVASANLSTEQVNLVKSQTAETYMRAMLDFANIGKVHAETETQKELAKYYTAQTGFVSLQAEDLRNNIKALSGSRTLHTVQYINGQAVALEYKVNAYEAKALSVQLGAMAGAADACRDAIIADWQNANEWRDNITAYWDCVNGSLNSVSSLVNGVGRNTIAREAVRQAGRSEVSVVNSYDSNMKPIGMQKTIRTKY